MRRKYKILYVVKGGVMYFKKCKFFFKGRDIPLKLIMMKNRLFEGLSVLVTMIVVAGMPAPAGAARPPTLGSLDLFVNAKAHDGNGSAGRPFSTIGEALSLARDLREASELPITINVSPGTYTAGYPGPDAQSSRERLPLVLDVNALTVRAVATSNGPDRPKVLASPPLVEDQAVFAIVADDVTIEGIAVRAGLTSTLEWKGMGIFIDRARDFVLRNVKVTRAFEGIFARLASGEIVDSEFTNNAIGTVVSAGSEELGYPGNIRYEANRASRNWIGGAFFTAGPRPKRRAPLHSK